MTAQPNQKNDPTAQQLRQELGASGLVPDGLSWSAFSGGRTNRIWKIGTGDDALVCKLFHQDGGTILFPNDIAAEEKALRELDGTGLAPAFVGAFQSSLGACLIYRHVPGKLWSGEVVVVGKALSALHGLAEQPKGFRNVAVGPDSILQTGHRILGNCTSSDAVVLAKLTPEGITMPEAQRVFLHGDLVPGNIIENGSDVCFIDWQCPAIGDPTEDIAIFLSPAMQMLYDHRPLTRAEIDQFFAAYGDPSVKDRYEKLKPFYHWRMAAHCLWKAEQGLDDYREAFELECAALEQC